MSKEFKLTNWQVPRSPEAAAFDSLKNAKPIDRSAYENMGKVEHHSSIQSVTEKMMRDYETKTGRIIPVKEIPIDEVNVINLSGINDTRTDIKYIKK